MKILLLLLTIVSFNIFAASDYDCQFRGYRLDLDMTNDYSTGIFIIDRFNYDTLYVGYVGFIERKSKTTDFTFYGNYGEHILSFNNTDLASEPERMKGWYEGDLRGFYIVDKFECVKR